MDLDHKTRSLNLNNTIWITLKRMLFVNRLGVRLLSTSARRGFATSVSRQEVHPNYARMKEQSKLYQINNGLLIHEKAGLRDTVLYKFILVCTWIVVLKSVHVIYILSFPDVKREYLARQEKK